MIMIELGLPPVVSKSINTFVTLESQPIMMITDIIPYPKDGSFTVIAKVDDSFPKRNHNLCVCPNGSKIPDPSKFIKTVYDGEKYLTFFIVPSNEEGE